MIYCFTSATASYLPNARILAKSVKRWHPEWRMVLLLSDESPAEVVWDDEPFDEVFFSDRLPIPHFDRWAYRYSVVELCTAVKGPMSRHLIERGASAVVYLDPDTVVFSRLEEMEELLKHKSALFTPHLTDPETEPYAIWSHEMAALKHGTFNLGFFAFSASEGGRRCLDWWADRVRDYSFIDFDAGLFTDQKWANLLPYLFDGVEVMRHRTYNVATWNITNRLVHRSPTGWTVNGEPLRFYHFSGFGHDFAWADGELKAFADRGDETAKLWDWYKRQYGENGLKERATWAWGAYANGLPIPTAHRRAMDKQPERFADILDPYSAAMYRRAEEVTRASAS
jgi:hypothetical protein